MYPAPINPMPPALATAAHRSASEALAIGAPITGTCMSRRLVKVLCIPTPGCSTTETSGNLSAMMLLPPSMEDQAALAASGRACPKRLADSMLRNAQRHERYVTFWDMVAVR